MIQFFLVIAMTFLGALGAFFFKKSTVSMTGIFSLLWVPSFYLGGFLYCSAALMNVILLRFMDYTVVYPMGAITYIWSLVLSNRYLGEKITRKKLAGVMLICAGVMLLAR